MVPFVLTRPVVVPRAPDHRQLGVGASDGWPVAAEFFAGVGLVRLGLEAAGFDVAWSNDIEAAKRAMYRAHFGEAPGHEFRLGDIAEVGAAELPAGTSLAWASFPCTDLSLAGWRRGLGGAQSSTFWHFTRIIEELGDERPPVVALENVVGLATSRGGEDLVAAIAELNRLGYSVDVLAVDARRFVPQSRPRLFLIGARDVPAEQDGDVATPLRPDWLHWVFHEPALRTHRAALPDPPPLMTSGFSAAVESIDAHDPRWWDQARSAAFFASLSPLQSARAAELSGRATAVHRTAYRRTRNGRPVWEIRPDDIAGCLRTARGGSSKQAVVQLGGGRRRVRWMTSTEYARLMGAPHYRIEGLRPNQVLFGFGDAVCVPVVTWLGSRYLMPLLRGELAAPASLAAAAG